MAYLQPCFNCATDKASCQRRKDILQSVKSMGVTSVKFACANRQSKFRPGQRVEFDWRHYQACDNDYYETRIILRGTIIREKVGNKRFSIRVDQDFVGFAEQEEPWDLKVSEVLRDPEFTSARPAHIRPLDQPDKPMCNVCCAYDEPDDIEKRCCGYGDLSNVSRTSCHKL